MLARRGVHPAGRNRIVAPATPGMARTRGSNRERDLAWIAAALAVIAAALYARQLFRGETFVLRDHLTYTWPERKILSDAFRGGRVPEWNDLVGFGIQFAASSANGVTYPPLWLVAALPLPFSMDLVMALHVLLSGIGTALFARRLGANAVGATFAGAAFMACGYVASIAPNKVFAGTAWIPWIAWAADRVARAREPRRASLFLAGILGAQLLAGDPASCVTGAAVALIVMLSRGRRQALPWLAAAYGVALLLAAASVLPSAALLPHTTRGMLALPDASLWSLHPWRLVELVWPGFLGTAADARYNLAELVAASGKDVLDPSWSLSLYLGAPVLALAVVAGLDRTPGTRGIWIGVAVLVLLALGSYTPLHSVFQAVFPPERVIRYPEKHVAGAVCLLCALAGAGLSRVARSARAVPWVFGTAIGCLVLPLILLSVLWPALVERLGGAAALMAPPIDVEGAMALSLRSGVVSAASAALTSWLLLSSSRHRAAGALAVALHVAHAGWEGWSITPVAKASDLSQPPRLLRLAPPRTGPPPRIFRPPAMKAGIPPEHQARYRHETLLLDVASRFGYAAVPGFEGWGSRKSAALWSHAPRMPLRSFLTLFAIDAVVLPAELRERLLGSGRGPPQGLLADLELGSSTQGEDAQGNLAWTLARTEVVRPRAFVAPRWQWVPESRALDVLIAPPRGDDPGLVVLTGEGTSSTPDRAALPLSPCSVASYLPEHVQLDCDSPAGGYATLVDEHAPGWTASVDGALTPIATADVLLRAVPVTRGRHRVEFSYRTPLLRAGIALSLVAWLCWAAVLRRSRTRAAAR
ncbi:MAG: YfhO family protein [Myxococcales bacterium]